MLVAVAVVVARRRPRDAPPARWVTEATPGYDIKLKLSSGIYHLPGMLAYERTQADRWYASADDAVADGFRAAKR